MDRSGENAHERLVFRELDSGVVAWPLFARRFGHPPPLDGHHVCAFVRDENDLERLACYIHFRPRGELLLGGGAVVDNTLLRTMQRATRERIRASGGLYRMSLTWALQQFRQRYLAVFGYCGDRLAERVDRAAGFVDTGHPRLLVYWLQDCDATSRQRLVASAHSAGPF